MANLIHPSNRLQKITWRQGSDKNGHEKLHFTLHTIDSNTGKSKPIAKASMTADQIAGFILKNSILKEE